MIYMQAEAEPAPAQSSRLVARALETRGDRRSGSSLRLRIFIVAVAIPLAGCATAPLGRAVELSATGSSASAKLLGASQTVESTFASSITHDRFLRALQAAGVPPGSGCFLATSQPTQPASGGAPGAPQEAIDKIAAALRARTQMATGLGKSYSAMNALAAYDARGAVESGLADVFSATNSLRTAFGLSPVSDSIGSISAAVGGALIQGRQLARVKRASARLRSALGSYKDALEHGRSPTVSLVKDGIEESFALRTALWRRGFLDASQILSEAGNGAGLVAITAEDPPFTARNETLCLGVKAALEGKRDEASRAVESEYQTQIEVIDEMIAAHEKFEKGAPIDAAHLAALLDQLTVLAGKIGGTDNASHPE
jgi:hypothetical protein